MKAILVFLGAVAAIAAFGGYVLLGIHIALAAEPIVGHSGAAIVAVALILGVPAGLVAALAETIIK